MNLKEIQNKGDYLVFVDENIHRPAIIELEAGNYEVNDSFYCDAWQLVFHVTIVRREPRETFNTSQGPIKTHVVYIDDVKTLRFKGPYFSFRSNPQIENAKMLAWCRQRVWDVDIATHLACDSKGTPPVINL